MMRSQQSKQRQLIQKAQSEQLYNTHEQSINNNANRPPQPSEQITIPQAIGLITIRLGKIEQYIKENGTNGGVSNVSNSSSTVNELSQISMGNIDVALDDITLRLESLEQRTLSTPQINVEVLSDAVKKQITPYIAKINKDIKSSVDQIHNINNGLNKLQDSYNNLEERFNIMVASEILEIDDDDAIIDGGDKQNTETEIQNTETEY